MSTPGATGSSLSPDVIDQIDDLEVAARVVVEGMRAGGHRSPLRGTGTEFQQHRPYRAGDDLRHLDWKLYARSDRLYTRQFLETTDLALQLVVDGSPSMAYPPEGISKLRYAKLLAASLAHLVIAQGGAVGLVTGDAEQLSLLPARSGPLHRGAVVARLDAMAPTSRWTVHAVHTAVQQARRRGILVVISDFYDDEEATLRELRTAAHRGHDVIMLQLLSPGEIELDVIRDAELQDLETGERRTVDAAMLREPYRARVRDFLARCRSGAEHAGIDYALVLTSTPPADALRAMLAGRAR